MKFQTNIGFRMIWSSEANASREGIVGMARSGTSLEGLENLSFSNIRSNIFKNYRSTR